METRELAVDGLGFSLGYVIIHHLLNISNAVRPAHLHSFVSRFSYLFLTSLILTMKCFFCEAMYFFYKTLNMRIQMKETVFSKKNFNIY